MLRIQEPVAGPGCYLLDRAEFGEQVSRAGNHIEPMRRTQPLCRVRLLDWMPSSGDSRNWVPLAEQEETEDAYLVRAELPGVPQDKVSVDIDDDQLAISGELDEQERGEGSTVLSRRTGRFAYRTSLPRGVNTEAVTAELKDGILTVRVPKSGEAKRRHVEIAGVKGD